MIGEAAEQRPLFLDPVAAHRAAAFIDLDQHTQHVVGPDALLGQRAREIELAPFAPAPDHFQIADGEPAHHVTALRELAEDVAQHLLDRLVVADVDVYRFSPSSVSK